MRCPCYPKIASPAIRRRASCAHAVTSVFWLGEPFLKRDMLGILVLVLGVACVVMSQVGAN